MIQLLRTNMMPVIAIGLLLTGSAAAQGQQQDPHHPAGAPATRAPAGMMMPMMGNMMGGGMMGNMMGGGMMGMMHQYPDGYAAFLKTELGITEAQNSVWKAYEEQLRALVKQHRDAMPMMQPAPDAKPLTWIERLTESEARISAHLEAQKKLLPAATALYAALTPEQKLKADTLMPGGMGMMGGMMGGMPGRK